MRTFFPIVLFFILSGCGSVQLSEVSGENVIIDSTIESSSLDSLYFPYKEMMDAEMNVVLGYSDTNFIQGQTETHLGNLIADIVHDEGVSFMGKTKFFGPDVTPTMALINFGGLRATINEGEITRGDIYSLMPFDNLITIAVLEPEQVKEMLKVVNESGGQPVSHCKIIMSGNQQHLFFDDNEYFFDKPVYVMTSDYLAGGGDKMDFFKSATHTMNTGILIRDAIINYVEKADTLSINSELDRIHIIR